MRGFYRRCSVKSRPLDAKLQHVRAFDRCCCTGASRDGAAGAILQASFWRIGQNFDKSCRSKELQHLSFTITGLIFWWSLLCRGRDGRAVLCPFATFMHTGLLGLLLTISGHPLYPEQTAFAGEFGLTPLEDQQLAGLVM